MTRIWMWLCCILLTTGVYAEDAYQTNARIVVDKYASGVVWVGATTKVDIGDMGQQEKRGNCLGIMIHESGLTMVSLNYFDQSELITAAVRKQVADVTPSVSMSDILITLANGTEIEAELVFKDPDLDLAFVLPNQDEAEDHKPFTVLPMDGDGKAQIMDRVFTIGRLEESYNRQIVVIPSYIASVLTKPRTYYYTKDGVPGSPAFKESGELLGLWITRFNSAIGTSSIRPMVLPITDIKSIAEQAIQAVEKEQK